MSENERAFLAEVDKRFSTQKNWFLSIITGLIIVIFSIGTAMITGVASNKENLHSVEMDVVDLKLYYVDVFMFRELMSSFQLYTDHITATMGGDVEELKSVNKRYDEMWNRILFDVQPSPIRGGSTGGNDSSE